VSLRYSFPFGALTVLLIRLCTSPEVSDPDDFCASQSALTRKFFSSIPILKRRCFSKDIPAFLCIFFSFTIPQRRTESYRTKENKRKTSGGSLSHRSVSFSDLDLGVLAGFCVSTENSSGWTVCSKSRKLRCISRLME